MDPNIVTAPLYTHLPLLLTRSIRVLDLEPAPSLEAPLKCSLREVAFEPASSIPSYDALSYVWGSTKPENLGPVHIKVPSGFYARLLVTRHCVDALRHIRLAQVIKTMWVDAICIDQTSVDEKNVQVPMMRELYRYASRVEMWLDLGSLEEDKAKRAFNHLRRQGRFVSNLLVRWEEEDHYARPRVATWMCERYCRTINMKLGGVLLDIFNNHYFSRIWTTQEFMLARTATASIVSVYGRIPLQDLVTGIKVLVNNSDFLLAHQSDILVLLRTNTLCNGLTRRPHFEDKDARLATLTGPLSFQSLQSLQCFEPRDKAYAFLWAFDEINGVAVESGVPPFKVDYSKSVEQVYTELAVAIMHSMGTNFPIYKASQRNKQYTVPSWVPDFSIPSRAPLYYGLDNSTYWAGGLIAERVLMEFRDDTMFVYGRPVTTIIWAVTISLDAVINASGRMTPAVYRFYHTLFTGLDRLSQNSQTTMYRLLQSLIDAQFFSEEAKEFSLVWKAEARIAKRNEVSITALRLNVLKNIMFAYDKLKRDVNSSTEALDGSLASWRFEMETILLPFFADAKSLRTKLQEWTPRDKASCSEWIFVLTLCHGIINFTAPIFSRLTSNMDTVFVAADGRIGTALDARRGDQVSVWSGLQHPVVMRKIDDGVGSQQDKWSLISYAHVQGIMHGEAYDRSKLVKYEVH